MSSSQGNSLHLSSDKSLILQIYSQVNPLNANNINQVILPHRRN